MRLGVLDEDSELLNESDKLQMWKKELEDEVAELKKDFLNCKNELKQNKIWKNKMERQISLLCKLNNDKLAQATVLNDCDFILDSEIKKDSTVSSIDRTSQDVYFFGSDKNLLVHNLKFNFFKEVQENVESICNSERKTLKINNKSNQRLRCWKSRYLRSKELRNNSTVCLSAEELAPIEKEDNSEGKSKDDLLPSSLENDLGNKQQYNKKDWEKKISTEVQELKTSLLEFKKEMKDISNWEKNVEKKINKLIYINQPFESRLEAKFETLNKKLDEHYLKIHESLIQIRLNQMLNSESNFKIFESKGNFNSCNKNIDISDSLSTCRMSLTKEEKDKIVEKADIVAIHSVKENGTNNPTAGTVSQNLFKEHIDEELNQNEGTLDVVMCKTEDGLQIPKTCISDAKNNASVYSRIKN